MAKGEGPCVRCWVTLTVVILVILAVTKVWNPYPQMWDWVNRSQPLSTPDPLWQQRVGALPRSVTIVGGAVVVDRGDAVEGRALANGGLAWERKGIGWNAVAGAGNSAVVVTGELLSKGYQVLSPYSGAVLREDRAAVGVWTFRNLLLDARCFAPKDCLLTAWDPGSQTTLWTAEVPGIKSGLNADNPEILGTKPLATTKINSDAGGPEPAPSLIGLPIDDTVYVLETASGRVTRVADPARAERVITAGGRVVRITATSADGTCYFTVAGHEAASGDQVWRQDALNLRTAEDAGCAQREDPAGGRNVVLGVSPDRREVLVDTFDGRLLWIGPEGDRVLAVDDVHAIVREEDGRTIRGYLLGRQDAEWERGATTETQTSITPYAAVLVQKDPDRIVALSPSSGAELLVLRSSADVLAVGPAGMVIGDGRDIGYVPFGGGGLPGVAPGAGSDNTAEPGDVSDSESVCDGPKEPNCTLPPDPPKDR